MFRLRKFQFHPLNDTMDDEKVIKDMSIEERMYMFEHFDHVYSLILDFIDFKKEYCQESIDTLYSVWEKINYEKDETRRRWTHDQFIREEEEQ